MYITNKDIIIRLVLAFILGGIIGFERQSRGKSAGVKTHILVTLGACLVTLNGVYIGIQTGSDPGRLSAQVITGIGFLGSGLILKDSDSIRGLTSASSIWLVGCIGIAVGSGFILGACVTSAMVIILLLFTRTPLYRKFFEENFCSQKEKLDDDTENFTD